MSDPAKWRIIGARAEAWLIALVDAAVATVERNATVRWRADPGTEISRTDRVVPLAAGALQLVVARSRLGDIADAGVTIGLGDPAIRVAFFPDCGCDACDSGSQHELDRLDEHLLGIVSGAFRRLTRGGREISTIGDAGWGATGMFRPGQVEAILADPSGWDEVSGTSWIRQG